MIGITGITGHIGYALANKLNQKGILFRALVRNVDDPTLQSISAEIFKGDILDPNSLDSFCKGLRVLIHLAGFVSIHNRDVENYDKINVEGVQNIIDACLKNEVDTLIHFSSIHAHRSMGKSIEINEQSAYAMDSDSPYDRSKARGEILVLEARKQGLNTVIVNPTGVIGPFDVKPSLTGQMLIKIYQGKLPILVRGGFDWLDVRVVVQAVLSILDQDLKNEKYILSGNFHSLESITTLVYAFKQKVFKGVFIPISLAKAGLFLAAFYSKISGKSLLFSKASLAALEEASHFVNGEKAEKALALKKISFEKTIFDTLQWFKDHQYLQ